MRESSRAIIIKDNSLVVMYREKEGRKYYTFPGGGLEENETPEECVTREVLEEFGIEVKPVKKVYEYKDSKTLQHYYLCEWISGELGSGVGEEYEADRNKGVYLPTLLPINSLLDFAVVPPEVSVQFFVDYKLNTNLRDKPIEIQGNF